MRANQAVKSAQNEQGLEAGDISYIVDSASHIKRPKVSLKKILFYFSCICKPDRTQRVMHKINKRF